MLSFFSPHNSTCVKYVTNDTLYITGRLTEVNRALAAVTFGVKPGFYGSGEKIDIHVSDNGNSGRVINVLTDDHTIGIEIFV